MGKVENGHNIKIEANMKAMKYFLILFLTVILINCNSNKVVYGKWETIFNGKDLTGWTPKFTGEEYGVNYKNTFRVENGKIVASYDNYDIFDNNFGHLFYKEKLSHFKLKVDYRFVGEQLAGGPFWAYRNSGIKYHSQPPQNLPKNQQLLVAIEAQMLGGNGADERPTGNVCTAGTHIVMDGELITEHCTGSSSKTYHGDQWVTMEIEVHGNGRVIHRVNGEKVLAYEKPQLDDTDPYAKELLDAGTPRLLSEGYIALQAESHRVEFCNIQLMRLKK